MNPEKPVYRRLRVFALDPSMTAQMDTTFVNEVVLRIPWEPLKHGPVGEYVAVIDQDESGRQLFEQVDLDDRAVLASDGLPPSDGNPRFHQQMVYAIAMQTIGTFEKALGRRVHWPQNGHEYIKQLKLYPHYFCGHENYSDPGAMAFFGYFETGLDSPFSGMIVFTCLSQDAIVFAPAYQILLAKLFQMYDKKNPDVEAFTQGFCDLIALLQRFSLPGLLRHQLALTRGDLAGPSQLGILSPQWGAAEGSKSGIRSAFGEFDENNIWHPKQPNPQDYQTVKEPYKRSSLLLGAVFDALNHIYRVRVDDLLRIATEGTGVLPAGDLHPDLVNRLAVEAAKSASHVLNMCVRALDYCPSLDITFGDYLRAIITADFDLVPNDVRNYRVAFVEAFRRYGIFPTNVGTLSIDTLLWQKSSACEAKVVQKFILQLQHEKLSKWSRLRDREAQYKRMKTWCDQLKDHLRGDKDKLKSLPGIDPEQPFSVHSIWPCERISPNGESLVQWVIEIVQKDHGILLAACTLIVEADTGLVRYAIGKREQEAEDLLTRIRLVPLPQPVERRLRVFAFDPSMATQIETISLNEATLSLPWEKLEQGPIGEYLEVIDYDPASDCFYDQVDLNHKYLIAEDGYAPSQANPQFHQQMVYAVAMRTIRNFEHTLGRLAMWSPHQKMSKNGDLFGPKYFVQRLRLYPHALREANAFYSPSKKAVLFGYFQSAENSAAVPVTVFTCLSHDIIVHEVTHALLDGMHGRFVEPSNPDILAFHEAFADIVALFQHFSLPEVLENQIAATRGDLTIQNRLVELAQELGSAIGNRGALRSAIRLDYDKATGQWQRTPPDPKAYRKEMEPHARGSLLVATVFDAFLTIYRSRVADLFRIATKGTGVLLAGKLHPDLIRRLAAEAANSAQGVLEICIRALDYCPPVDITFGDYLRAIVTADFEIDPIDPFNHRVAFVEAFRRHGILPDDVHAFSLEGLLLKHVEEKIVLDLICTWTDEIELWSLTRDRKSLFNVIADKCAALQDFLKHPAIKKKLGFIADHEIEVQALRPSKRIDWQSKPHSQWIIEITQQIPEFLEGEKAKAKAAKPDYFFRGGATLLVDAETGQIRYCIRKRLDDQRRREKQRRYMTEIANCSLSATYFRGIHEQEPFAALYRF